MPESLTYTATLVRALAIEDLHEVLPTYVSLYTELDPAALPVTKETLTRALSEPHTIIAGAFVDARLVGTATLCIIHTPNKTLACIEGVVVSEEARGEGMGFALITFLLEQARLNKASGCQLTCNTSPERDAAHALYQKLGFAPITHTVLYRKKIEK